MTAPDPTLLALAVCEASLALLDADAAKRVCTRELSGKHLPGWDFAAWFRRSSAIGATHAEAMLAWRDATARLRDARGTT